MDDKIKSIVESDTVKRITESETVQKIAESEAVVQLTDKHSKLHTTINKISRFFCGPPLKEIEKHEKDIDHFAKGICFYKLFWIFFIGAFAGVAVEIIWCFITGFNFEYRTGMIFGPFNAVYGLGAVALTLGLYWLRYQRDFYILVGGTVIGGAIEYGCSWSQEKLFGTVSWDYSYLPFNINGRICLLYSMFWGILAIIWLKMIYPRMCSLIMKIPNKVGRPISWVLIVYMIINMLFSGAAVLRWSQRLDNVPPASSFQVFLDEHFPNSTMEIFYQNMRFTDDGEINTEKGEHKGDDTSVTTKSMKNK